MADAFATRTPAGMVVPATSCVAITAGSTEITATRAVFCNSSGNFTMQFVGDAATVTLGLTAGVVYPFRVNYVTAGTGLYALR